MEQLLILLLIMSNFTVCHNVFKSRLLQRHQKVSVCGKVLIRSSSLHFCLAHDIEVIFPVMAATFSLLAKT